ncbi:MAG: hypothetical protein KC547_08295 [Anaerolineae bacterium]|nr:hypothetical protein [Anaerolineae bacterium]
MIGITHWLINYTDYCGFPSPASITKSRLSQVVVSAENALHLSPVLELRGYERQSVVFSPNSRWLVSSGQTRGWSNPLQDFRDGACASVWIVDLDSLTTGGQLLRVLKQRMETIFSPSHSLAIDPNSELVVLGNRQVVDLETGQVLTRLKTNIFSYIQNMSFSPDGRYLIASDGIAGSVWSTDNFTLLHSILALPSDRYFTRGPVAFIDQDVILVSKDEEPLRFWDVTTGEVVGKFPLETQTSFTIVDVNASRHLFAYHANDTEATYVVDVEAESSWLVAQEPMSHLTFSPSGEFMAVALADRIAIYDVSNSRVFSTIARSNNPPRVTAMTFSPREDLLAVGHNDGSVDIISLDGQLLTSLRVDSSQITDLAFNPAATLLAISAAQPGENKGGVWIWQVEP